MFNPKRALLMFLIMVCIQNSVDYSNIVYTQENDVPQIDSATLQTEIISYLLNFDENLNEGCILPCFAGIRPSETTLSELIEFSEDLFDGNEDILAVFDNPFEREDGLLDYTFRFPLWEVSGSYNVSYIVSPEQNIMQQFRSYINQPANWLNSDILSISNTLHLLDEPSDIYISISGSQPSYFEIALAYKALGILFVYKYYFEPEQLTQGDEPIPLCGSWEDVFQISVWIQAVDAEMYQMLMDERLRLEEENTTEIVYRTFRPLHQMTNWDKTDLTQYLIHNPDWCIDAHSYEELRESGYSY